jgi:hypothetical protein
MRNDGRSADVRGMVITKLTVAFRVRVLLTTVILFGYSPNQGLNSEVCQNFGVAQLFGRRGMCR